MKKILLVEDEYRVADFIRRGLGAEGYVVEHVGTGEEALERVGDDDFQLIILDLMLPGMSGQSVCKTMRVRGQMTPILMLTALGNVSERVEGLRLGADDYLPKPFDFDELLARIEALTRRGDGSAGANDATIVLDDLTFNLESLEVFLGDDAIELSRKERDMLRLFLTNKGKVLSRERILNGVWSSQEDPMTNVVDVYVARLRKKLGDFGARIVTVRGAGYRLG